jgi:hypothetical protein
MDNLTATRNELGPSPLGAARAILPPSAFAGLEFVLFIGLALGISSGSAPTSTCRHRVPLPERSSLAAA